MATAIPIQPQSISTEFKASWPEHLDPALKSTLSKVMRILWNIISIIIFPIGLCRLAYWGVREIALRIAIPGPPFLNRQSVEGYLDFHNGFNVKLSSPDGLKLDGAFFPGQNRKKAIVFSPGNAMSWETSEMYLNLFRPLNISVLMVNPRGIGKSEGYRSEEGFALDIYTAYEYLINEEGLNPEDITQVGFSMGGGYGAEGAALVQKKYPDQKLNAMNIRSFSDLRLEVETLLKKVGGCMPFLLRYGAKLAAYKMNPKDALDTLKGHVCVVSTPADGIITEAASMIKAMKDSPKRPITHIQLHAERTKSAQEHIRDFYPDERLAILEQLRLLTGLEKADLDPMMLRIFQTEVSAYAKDVYFRELGPLKIEQIG